MAEDPLAAAVAEVLQLSSDVVERWRRNEPGAWGHLAGQGVLAYRRRLERPLTDAERRRVWSALWAALQHTRL
jgi:hypothetical protein